MTTLQEEFDEYRRHWALQPEAQAYGPAFEQLIRHEFLEPWRIQDLLSRQLEPMVRHAVEQVPYYADLFARLKLTAADVVAPQDLPKLPALTKQDLAQAGDSLMARELPPGEQRYGWFSSSGSTGRPARVMHTQSSNLMFNMLQARSHRWYRLEPQALLATIRLASQVPRRSDGSPLPNGETLRLPRRLYSGLFFETGPQLFFNVENPVEDQLRWLGEQQPRYLQSYSESLEHLAFACEGKWPASSLQKAIAISEQLTPSMRRVIERALGVSVHQGYGLNEIGLVAAGCSAGRYHVHIEHCLVEIADDRGQPVSAGGTGHVLVTGLRNAAMPLLRYDTGDIATAVEEPCPCGSTLPSFGSIVGRYSRIAYLPPGTLGRVGVLREALELAPLELSRTLRQFQIHQHRSGDFTLRLVTAGEPAPTFHEHILSAWRAGSENAGLRLEIVQVGSIPRGPGGKTQDFTSDFVPAPDS